MRIPNKARILLDFIGSIEAPKGYNTIYGNKQYTLKTPITQMTFDQVLDAQRGWTRRHGSSAAGRYQFMRNTLKGLKSELRLTGKELFTPQLQDRMGFHLLKRRGYQAFVEDNLSVVSFGKKLAQEWASFPVLADTEGAHRFVRRGETYYAGDRLNKALVKPAEIEKILAQVKSGSIDDRKPAPKIGTKKQRLAQGGVVGVILVILYIILNMLGVIE